MNLLESYKPMFNILLIFGLISFNTKNNEVIDKRVFYKINLIRFLTKLIFEIVCYSLFLQHLYLFELTGRTNTFASAVQVLSQFILNSMFIALSLWKNHEHLKFFENIQNFDLKCYQLFQIKRQEKRIQFYIRFIVTAIWNNASWIMGTRETFMGTFIIVRFCLCSILTCHVLAFYHFELCAWALIYRYRIIQKLLSNAFIEKNFEFDKMLNLLDDLINIENQYRNTFGAMLLILITFCFIRTTENVYSLYVRLHFGLFANSSFLEFPLKIYSYILSTYIPFVWLIRSLHILSLQVSSACLLCKLCK